MNIREWQKEVYELAESNGFHGGPLGVMQQGEPALPQIGLKLALIHGETSEALEELRDNPRKLRTYVNVPGDPQPLFDDDLENLDQGDRVTLAVALGCGDTEQEIRAHMQTMKPEGFEVELADVVIRCLDLAAALGLDLETAMERKHDYNKSRPFMHGKKA